jgi:GNAT superfamily N-acetyltransferase
MIRTQASRVNGATRAGGRAAQVIRAARPDDLPALSDFLTGLSAQTRYLRFFAPVTPGAAMLALLSGGPGASGASGASNQADAVVAVRDGVIIGHAMAVDRAAPGDSGGPCGERRTVTDIGVVVADAWQGRGVGAALTRVLVARARDRGVASAAMDVLPGNHRALAMIAGHWPAASFTGSPDCTTVSCPLPPPESRHRPRPAPLSALTSLPAEHGVHVATGAGGRDARGDEGGGRAGLPGEAGLAAFQQGEDERLQRQRQDGRREMVREGAVPLPALKDGGGLGAGRAEGGADLLLAQVAARQADQRAVAVADRP